MKYRLIKSTFVDEETMKTFIAYDVQVQVHKEGSWEDTPCIDIDYVDAKRAIDAFRQGIVPGETREVLDV
jgi:hypothetical protein